MVFQQDYNMNVKQIQELPIMNRNKNTLLQLFYVAVGIVFIFMAVKIFNGLKPLVDDSYSTYSTETSDPDTLLNHANTYYWWGRYRKNTLPEFDTAASWANKALQLAEARFKQDKDTVAFQQRKLQAEQIIILAKKQADICRYNIGSYLPLYMEIMGYDDDYMHEDADPADVPQVALRNALDRLVELSSPDRNQLISARTNFVLLNVNTSNPKAEEMLVQELNNKTRMYTIAPHELAKIAGKDSITVAEAIKDSVLIKNIASTFNTDELAVIDFIENDKVNGIYYYGMRFKLWTLEKGWNSRNVYTEYMIRDRVFNQVTVFIGQLLMVLLLLSLAINFIMIPVSSWLVNMKTITPYYLLLCFIIAAITQYLLVTFGLKNFLNPQPDDYFVSDMGEQWAFVYPLTFIIPVFITYLVLGKMDNFISSFRSDFENPLAIFALVAGSLLPAAFSFTYFNILRFGFGSSAYAIFTIIVLLIFFAIAISRYWSAIVHFPQKIHIAIRGITWVGLVVHFFIALSFFISLLQIYDSNTIDDWFFSSFLLPAGAIEFVRYLIVIIVNKITRKKIGQLQSISMPEGIQQLKINSNDLLVEFSLNDDATGTQVQRQFASLYVRTQRGTPTKSTVEYNLLKDLDNIDYLVIDFANSANENEDVHYLPFAKAFEERLSYTKFNDIAETARKTSNLIGKALSAITSAAGFLIDEGKTKPRNPDELSDLLMKQINKRKTILLFDHIEKIDEENIQLFESFVNLMIRIRQEKSDGKKPRQIPLLIVCGTGEFGYRDKVISILKKLRIDRIHDGVLEFEMKFEKAVDNFLSLQCMPVQAEIHLKELYKKEQRDYAPDVVVDTFDALRRNNSIQNHTIGGIDLLLLSIPDVQHLPDNRIGQHLEEAVRNHTTLKEVLIAAAYLADANAKFYLPVLAHVLKKDRIEVLHLLKEAEHFNLVYDLKRQEDFYWYAFTDRGLVADFKELENPRQEQVSQLAYEYYRGYVEFYCQHHDVDKNVHFLNEMLHSEKLSADSLLLLANRSFSVMPAFSDLAFAIHFLTANYFGNNSIARFDEALDITNKALAIYESLHKGEKKLYQQHCFELRQLKFQLLIETGKSRSENIDALYASLEADPYFPKKYDSNWITLISWKIRLCFTRFNETDKDQGIQLCQDLLGIAQLDQIMRLRIIFYQLKLVPSNLLIFSNPKFSASQVITVNNQYTQLIQELDAVMQEGNTNANPLKEIYREVLNDYAGSFLVDKILPVFDAAKDELKVLWDTLQVDSASDLFIVVKNLLAKRIQLELGHKSISVNINKGLSVFDQENLDYILHNNQLGMDKRGLCYTLNYYSRALRSIGNEEDAYRYAGLSYQFNRKVGDKTGACIAAGTAGFAASTFAKYEDAYYWFRTSFGIGWSIKHPSLFNMVIHMLYMARLIGDNRKMEEVKFYCRQIELRSVISFMEKKTISDDLAIQLLTNRQEIIEQFAEKKQLPEPYNQLGNSPNDFINTLHQIVRQNDFNYKQFMITTTLVDNSSFSFMKSKKVVVSCKDNEQTLIIHTSSIKDTEEWLIVFVEIGKSN